MTFFNIKCPIQKQIFYLIQIWPTELVSAPSYIQALVKPYTPARALRLASANRLATPSLRVGPRYPSKTSKFALLDPKCWNEPSGQQKLCRYSVANWKRLCFDTLAIQSNKKSTLKS